MPRLISKNKKINSQQGAVLVLGSILIILFIIIGALIIDLLRVERAARSLQNAADAAALAGASKLNRTYGHFDGDQAHWRKAKWAAIAALRENSIFGEKSSFDTINLNGLGYNETYNDLHPYNFTTYNISTTGVEFAVERLFYFRKSSNNEPAYFSLEGWTTCEIANDPIITELPGNCCQTGANSYQLANSVKVTLTLHELPLFFGKFLGLTKINAITRTSTAAPDIPPNLLSPEACSP